MVGTFIVNYDMMNNTRIWHLNNDVTDGYYKHLYPVTEKQYEKLTELQEESAAPLSEEVIMDVINSVEYKPSRGQHRQVIIAVAKSNQLFCFYSKLITDMKQSCTFLNALIHNFEKIRF